MDAINVGYEKLKVVRKSKPARIYKSGNSVFTAELPFSLS